MLISVPEWDSVFAFINKELCLIEHELPLVNKGYPMEIIAYV